MCGSDARDAFRYSRSKLSSGFRDSHVYVCKRTVLDVLAQKEHLESLREEFIPWLCKPQYQRTRREKYGNGEACLAWPLGTFFAH